MQQEAFEEGFGVGGGEEGLFDGETCTFGGAGEHRVCDISGFVDFVSVAADDCDVSREAGRLDLGQTRLCCSTTPGQAETWPRKGTKGFI